MDANDLQALHDILRSRGGFSHREHLELTWTYLGRYPLDGAHRTVAAAIRQVAEQHGAPDKYHETITGAWVRLVAAHRSADTAGTFDEFIARNPGLLDQKLLTGHYSRERLTSSEARSAWTEPDLRPLPLPA
jgi:hypothetical protein